MVGYGRLDSADGMDRRVGSRRLPGSNLIFGSFSDHCHGASSFSRCGRELWLRGGFEFWSRFQFCGDPANFRRDEFVVPIPADGDEQF